ncbi:MAG: serine/threonine-protein kinase [Ruminococcus sp.]|nr:serine/threonine-protein kinase [Ruminococcus sp.]
MADSNLFELWQFDKVREINSAVSVVRRRSSGKLMLHRVSAPESYGVMKAVSALYHPNLMRVYDTVLTGKTCVSLCEYIEGETLEQAVSARGVYTEDSARQIMIQVCAGLTELHRHGIIHRDINPSNVMVQPDGTVKIIDYNITRITKPDAKKDTTIYGTVGYTPPEQFGFAQTDARSDVYSCGVLLNYLLTGYLPHEVLYQGELGEIIRQCIEIDSEKRYESAQMLSEVLQGRRFSRELKFRPLPGFRSGKTWHKVLAVLGFIVYFSNLAIYLVQLSQVLRGKRTDFDLHVYMLTQLTFFSAFPYILFGDVFYISRRICPKNHERGRVITYVLGGLCFLIGYLIIAFSVLC